MTAVLLENPLDLFKQVLMSWSTDFCAAYFAAISGLKSVKIWMSQ